MAKIRKVSAETKSAIRRKSAYTLPNNPSDSGYKADDIRRAFWQPIVDVSQSTIAEIDRVIDDVNAIFEQVSLGISTIESVAGEYYHSDDGFIYSFDNNEFTICGYEGESDKIEIPSEVLYNGINYKVIGIAKGAFEGMTTVLFRDLLKIEEGAFIGNTSFAVPKEFFAEYQELLKGFTIVPYDTVTSNEARISFLETKSIDRTEVTYQLASSGTEPPTGGWSPSVPAASSGQYIWTRIQFILHDGTMTTAYSVSRIGETGPKGDSIQGPPGPPGEQGPKGDKGDGLYSFTVQGGDLMVKSYGERSEDVSYKIDDYGNMILNLK